MPHAHALLRRLAVFALLLVLAAVGAAARAEEARLTFLHVNDVYEFQPGEGFGGLAALRTLVRAERHRDPQALLTFGGDLLSPSVVSSVTQGRHMVEFFNRLGVTAAGLGNHEFDFGADVLRQRMTEARFPWLAANVAEPDGRPFGNALAHTIVEAHGIKIGLFGLLTVETAHLSAGAGETLFRPEIEAARQAVAALRARGAEAVVALTHLDLEQDRKLLREVRGIDLVLGGHDHNAVVLEEEGALIVKAGENASHLAVVELAVTRRRGADGRTTVATRAANWRFLSTLDVRPERELAAQAAAMAADLDRALGAPLTVLSNPLDSREEVVRGREAAIGNLVADALRAALGADAALINGGSLRGNRLYAAGHALTRADVLGEFPFRNAAALIEVSGADLLAALENGLSRLPARSGRFPQVSGLAVTYDPAAEPGKRIVRVMVGERPLDPAARYRLATNSYLADGGDGYAALKNGRVLIERMNAPILTTLLIDHLATRSTIAATVEGRIVEGSNVEGSNVEGR